jgi:hydrogenase small subunit
MNQYTEDFWTHAETLGEHLARRGLDRREFLGWCARMAMLMGVGPVVAEGAESSAGNALAARLEALKRPVVIWLQLQECTGCLESTLRSYGTGIGDLVLNLISMQYVELLMAAAGQQANEALEEACSQDHILLINGSIPRGADGGYCTIGGESAEAVLRKAAAKSKYVLAVGACAYYGCVQAANPNPTRAIGVQDILTDRAVINVPGCPPIGEVITGCITYILSQGHVPPCDAEGRPLFAYGGRIHDNCPRRAYYDAGQFVGQFDDAAARQGYCLYHMGCKGPETFSPCPVVKWNGGTSFPIQAGHPCIGCTEKHFFDRMTPFYSILPTVPGVGVESTANKIGALATGAALIGIAAHAVGSAIGLRKTRMKQEAVVSLPVLGPGGTKPSEGKSE